jgi:hypothetical protein
MSKTLKVIAMVAALIGAAVIGLSFLQMPPGWHTLCFWAMAVVVWVLWPVIFVWSLIHFVKRKNWIMALFLIAAAILVLGGFAPGAAGLWR